MAFASLMAALPLFFDPAVTTALVKRVVAEFREEGSPQLVYHATTIW